VVKKEGALELIRSVDNLLCDKNNNCNMMHNILKLMQQINKTKQGHFVIYSEDLTQQIRNLLTNGTITLSLPQIKESQRLLLILTGSWSGGAFDPRDVNLYGISASASQHFIISYSEGKRVISKVYENPTLLPKKKENLESSAEFRMLARSNN